jgi:hypothetical protein
VWVRGEVTAEATVGGPNKGDCHNPVGELVGATPEAENEQLGRERLGNVHGFERLVLEGNHAALTDGLTHAHICARLREGRSAGGHSAKHCCLATVLEKKNDGTANEGLLEKTELCKTLAQQRNIKRWVKLDRNVETEYIFSSTVNCFWTAMQQCRRFRQ